MTQIPPFHCRRYSTAFFWMCVTVWVLGYQKAKNGDRGTIVFTATLSYAHLSLRFVLFCFMFFSTSAWHRKPPQVFILPGPTTYRKDLFSPTPTKTKPLLFIFRIGLSLSFPPCREREYLHDRARLPQSLLRPSRVLLSYKLGRNPVSKH